MKKAIAALLTFGIIAFFTGCSNQTKEFKTEKCIAISASEFKSEDGNIFEINNDNLINGEQYWVIFNTCGTSNREDDEIIDFDTELYYKWVQWIN